MSTSQNNIRNWCGFVMKILPAIVIVLVALSIIFLYGCKEDVKPALEKSISYSKLSESDIFNNYDEDVKKSLRKLIATNKCLKCTFVGAILSGKDLKGKNAKIFNVFILNQ